MPTYEYSCPSCEEVFEVFQSMRDAPLTECPKCGRPGVKRLIGRGAGIIFKGSGFYETDYKRSPEKAEAKTGSAAGGGEPSKGSDSAKSGPSASPSSTKPSSSSPTKTD